MPKGEPSNAGHGPRHGIRAMLLVGVGASLAVMLAGLAVVTDLRFDGGRLVHAALGIDALAAACKAPLLRHLAEKGFEPDEVEFGPAPIIGSPFGHDRRFGDSFTFQDGAARRRVDGVVACVVSGGTVTVEVRVGSNPHRDA